jgi:L-asparaginase
MSNPKVHVIITGGTIDAEWNAARDTAVTREESIIPAYLDKLKLDIDFTYKTVCMKDSRELTHDDLKAIADAVENAAGGGAKVLITHGTYTMPDTARYIQAHLKDTSKAVILTGSLVPLEGYSMSDAPFNLGFSIATLLTMEPGVLLSMNGSLFTPQEVAKNMSEARFFSVEQ